MTVWITSCQSYSWTPKKIGKILETKPQSSKNAPKLIKIKKIHDVEKSTLVFGGQYPFCVPSLSLAQKTLKKKLGQNCFENLVSEFKKKMLNLALNVLIKKVS